MAGYMPNPWVGRMLEALVGKTAVSTGTVYLGLAWTVPDDPLTSTLANIGEVNTAGYARKAIPAFGTAVTSPIPAITTPTAFTFTAFTADMAAPAPYAFLTDAATGTAGTLRYLWELPSPIQVVANVPVNVPASTLIIE